MRIIISCICILLLFSSCSLFSSKNKDKIAETQFQESQLMKKNTKKMKRIFFVLPSPIEISLLIKKSGVSFHKILLNSTDNLPGYSTSPSRAIALGVYCADLSYASLYEQYQISVEYINVARNLAESLGVLRTVDHKKIKMLENNVTNKDLIVDIVSEIYMESSEQLREQDRYSLAALMLIGSWVESMYLATQSVSLDEESHKLLIKHIVDQKLSIESIKTVLRDNQSDPTIKPIYMDILQLEKLFEKCLKKKNSEEITDFRESVDSLVFVQLVSKVAEMREYLVQ